jgi:hypothetical protein
LEDHELAKDKDTLDVNEFKLISSSPYKVKIEELFQNYILLEVFVNGVAYLSSINFSVRFWSIVIGI